MIESNPNQIENLASSTPSQELIFIDSELSNYNSLVPQLGSQAKIAVLDSKKDEIEQITEILSQYQNVSSLHIFSHGENGNLKLNNTVLNNATLTQYEKEITGWSKSLSDQADILLYGCNIAQTPEGETFVQRLADLTGADLAASNNLTGNQALGGDWTLEYQTGQIETQTLQSENFQSVLHADFVEFLETFTTTHTAVRDGSWFDPNTWGGSVPGNEAGVFIPAGRTVTYDGESIARLKTVRVDGAITFASDKNSSMLVDTFGVAPTGKLTIGTATNPIQADKTVKITFRSDTAINTAIDTKQFGKGLVSHGQVDIYGADKLDYTALQGDALRGSRELVLSTTPTSWKVGDQLVLGGTSTNFNGSHANNSFFQDEVLTITGINGNRISFTNNDISSGDRTVLRFDHQRPILADGSTGGTKLYVANTTRNIIFQSEQGATTPIARRGHVMLMDNPDVEVNNAGFYNLGRTDKTRLIDDVGTNMGGSPGNGTNVRGRYPLHIHRTGAEDINSVPVKVMGNAVVGSPGWGIAQHESNAILENNVVFDVAGAGIVSEAGNELGAWRNNITIKMRGDGNYWSYIPSDDPRSSRYDFGHEGEGFWVQGGAGLEVVNNISISNAGAGIDYMNSKFDNIRDATTFKVSNLAPDVRSVISQTGLTEVDIKTLPIRKLTGFETYNSLVGMSIFYQLKNEDGEGAWDGGPTAPVHQLRSVVQDFKLWNIQMNGLDTRYTTNLDLVNGLIAGAGGGSGIRGNNPSMHHLYKNLRIEDFASAVRTPDESEGGAWYYGFNPLANPLLGTQLVDSYLANNDTNFQKEEAKPLTNGSGNSPTWAFPDYFQIKNTTIVGSGTITPATFDAQSAGGLAMRFNSLTSNQTIASCGWDFNNDGQIDKFGREVDYTFNAPGTYQVKLTVWNARGDQGTVTKTINVQPTAYSNLLLDSNFSSTQDFYRESNAYRLITNESNTDLHTNLGADYGWIASNNRQWNRSNGTAVLSGQIFSQSDATPFGQVLYDDFTRRGQQQFSVSVKNTEGNASANQVAVRVWGINGRFKWNGSGPSQNGVNPTPTIAKLLDQTVGGSTFDWRTFNWDVNFGSGYQFVLVQVTPQNFNSSNGDFFAVDNFQISGSGTVTPPPPAQDISYGIVTSQGTLTEGNSGNQLLTFTVTRTGATQNASSVNYSIGGTATNGSDYNSIGGTSGATGLTGTVNFAASETSKTITLNVLGDAVVEPDETIQVALSNATAPGGTATITTTNATTTIRNDDSTSTNNISYSVATNRVSLAEGNTGSQTVTFTVRRSGATQNASSVNYSIGGTATNGSDYNSIGGTSGATGLTGTVNFAANQTSKTITLNVLGDRLVESNETILVTLSNGTAPNGTATITTSTATTTINNDDSTTVTGTSLFGSTATPTEPNATDGTGSAGDYELGMEFRTARAGQIQAIRYYKAPSETGTHIGRIWSSTGQLLASVTFTNETASGWQVQSLSTPLTIQANTTYIVSVNCNQYYANTENGLATTITNGDLSAIADGSNGVFNTSPGLFPTQSWNNSNYYRDVIFIPA